MIHPHDTLHLQQALEQAAIRRGFCAPNPAVGAVIVRDHQIIASGYHWQAGHPHAEVVALANLPDANNATLYVTLEPCCHHGKTPPCTDAIIQSGIKRVVYGYQDPNPLVAGKGQARLIQAGIECEYVPLAEISAFYESYHYWHQTHLPFVTIKIALTLDGKIAGAQGQPIAITGSEVNALTHIYRKNSDAILTTVNTILSDDPQLNARIHQDIFPKNIYILDRDLKLPDTAKIFQTAKSLTVFHAPGKNSQHLIALGVRCIEETELAKILEVIGKDGVHDLWVEAGGKCFSAFVKQKLYQRMMMYVAPHTCLEGVPAFTNDFDFSAMQWRQVGRDLVGVMSGS